MSRKEFADIVRVAVGQNDVALVMRAYWLAKEVHRQQKRDTGERYFEHCRRVAKDSGETKEFIVSLLHDCVEDGFAPQDIVAILFGEEISDAVNVLSKLIPVFDSHTGRIIRREKKGLNKYWESLMAASIWIRRIKCRDRLDNLRSMHIWTPARKEKYIRETEEYVLPLAEATDAHILQELKEIVVAY